jgi:hypothetical protein
MVRTKLRNSSLNTAFIIHYLKHDSWINLFHINNFYFYLLNVAGSPLSANLKGELSFLVSAIVVNIDCIIESEINSNNNNAINMAIAPTRENLVVICSDFLFYVFNKSFC